MRLFSGDATRYAIRLDAVKSCMDSRKMASWTGASLYFRTTLMRA
jgi:hypothetical protein